MRAICLVLSAIVSGSSGTCTNSNWTISFDKRGHSSCTDSNANIRGLYRDSRKSPNEDPISNLDFVRCCDPLRPWFRSRVNIVYANWMSLLNNKNIWAKCPKGYFLQGLYREDGNGVSNIEFGKCSKPVDHPLYYGECYELDIKTSFDDLGYTQCNDGYYITGLFKAECDQLNCIDKLMCCKMAEKPQELDETFKVKSLVMDKTVPLIANLASVLGYAWCASCIALYVGQDYRRNGDTWVADKAGRCEGYKSDQRLSITYGDWSYGIKDIKYGDPVISDLEPETYDSGTLINNDANNALKSITRTVTSVRSVTHTTESAFKDSHELGIEVKYNPPPIGGISGSSAYKFNYEKSTTTIDEKKVEQTQSFLVKTDKELPPYSSVKWRISISKTKTTIPYTATVIARFSAELGGFLRWGGRAGSRDTNYHVDYKGKDSRPTVNYKFGDAKTPFYTALKRQSETNSRPWLWTEMQSAQGNAGNYIRQLTNESEYVFTLKGKFDDVVGKHVDVTWEGMEANRSSG
ncbi:aerolysin-like [Physella acuta]|uniref:aerolysin-like n=1 Tax=Physella acuta TaxID=109671 RepID=UPI0027DE1F34|nr:aerolysin-like [Physella acuta]